MNVKTLNKRHIELITYSKEDEITIVDYSDELPETTTIQLTESQAVTIHKLIAMPSDPIPEYRGERRFTLNESIPRNPGETPGPFIATEGGSILLFEETREDAIEIVGSDIATLEKILRQWEYTMQDGYSILTFPAMCQLEDGISEPVLDSEFDEVLENYHNAVGYWSPSRSEYVHRH